MLWKTSSVKGHVGVSLLLPQEVLEVTQCRLWILDGLRGGKKKGIEYEASKPTITYLSHQRLIRAQALVSIISSPLPTTLGRGGLLSSPCLLHCLQRIFHFLSGSQSLGFSSWIP